MDSLGNASGSHDGILTRPSPLLYKFSDNDTKSAVATLAMMTATIFPSHHPLNSGSEAISEPTHIASFMAMEKTEASRLVIVISLV